MTAVSGEVSKDAVAAGPDDWGTMAEIFRNVTVRYMNPQDIAGSKPTVDWSSREPRSAMLAVAPPECFEGAVALELQLRWS